INATYCASVEDIAVQYCFLTSCLLFYTPRNVSLQMSAYCEYQCIRQLKKRPENALEKPLDIRKLDHSSYQALEACFKPYKAFLKR
ncbi:hypothetical protein Tco_0403423, partial [Tanacetum coccineum]